jgi:hypothetical protein
VYIGPDRGQEEARATGGALQAREAVELQMSAGSEGKRERSRLPHPGSPVMGKGLHRAESRSKEFARGLEV